MFLFSKNTQTHVYLESLSSVVKKASKITEYTIHLKTLNRRREESKDDIPALPQSFKCFARTKRYCR